MTHFGIFCFPSPGHLYPFTTLGHELKQRGHRVTLIGRLDEKDTTTTAGLEFYPIAEQEFPLGSTRNSLAQLGKLSGLKALDYTITFITEVERSRLEYTPKIIKKIGIEVLLVDQAAFAGATIAEFLKIPFITVSNALVFNQDLSVPPHCFYWQYDSSWLGQLRNRIGYSILAPFGKPMKKLLNEYRQKWNLSQYSNLNESYSKLAQISQQPVEFEFPRANLPLNFHFSGPFHSVTTRKKIDFPWHKLTNKPLIYASMGTLQNRLLWVFEMIAQACENLDVQLIISLGSSQETSSLKSSQDNLIVVKYAPQLALLQKASLCITHAGMNTTLESLSNGVPMIAIPITNDQPGVAARIKWTGTGEAITLSKLNKKSLKTTIEKVLTQVSYKENAKRLQKVILNSGGVIRAADLVEKIITQSSQLLSANTIK